MLWKEKAEGLEGVGGPHQMNMLGGKVEVVGLQRPGSMKALNNFSEGFLLSRRRLQVLPEEYRVITLSHK